MQMENRFRLSEQRLTLAQQDHEAAHNDYYDVRISLFELDEAWTQAKLCKNFVNLMTSLNQVKGKRGKRELIIWKQILLVYLLVYEYEGRIISERTFLSFIRSSKFFIVGGTLKF